MGGKHRICDVHQVLFDITTWILARSKCKAVGGDLVKIVNKAMNRFIRGERRCLFLI